LSFDEKHQFFEGFQNTTISPYLILEFFKKQKKNKNLEENQRFLFLLNSKHLKKKTKPEQKDIKKSNNQPMLV
jgi:hypothetical protein